jgi:hypothetical protein
MFSDFFFPLPKNRTVYEIMSKHLAETEGPQMTSQYGEYELRAGLTRLLVRAPMHTQARMRARSHTHK